MSTNDYYFEKILIYLKKKHKKALKSFNKKKRMKEKVYMCKIKNRGSNTTEKID